MIAHRIKIISSKLETYWYFNKIGEIYWAELNDSNNGYQIVIKDADIINNRSLELSKELIDDIDLDDPDISFFVINEGINDNTIKSVAIEDAEVLGIAEITLETVTRVKVIKDVSDEK